MSADKTSNAINSRYNSRRRLARIRCIMECIACFRESRQLPRAICYVPGEVSYQSKSKINIKVYPDMTKTGKKLMELALSSDSRICASGEENCNAHGKWIRLKKYFPSSGGVLMFVEPSWVLLYGAKSTGEDMTLKKGSMTDSSKKTIISDKWEDVVESHFAGQFLTRNIKCCESDTEAEDRLQGIPHGWTLDSDEELVSLMSSHIPPDNDHLGTIKNFVESIDVSSSCDDDGGPSCLTDGDPDTYWESDGSQGNHWIRINMKKGTVIMSMHMILDSCDDNYLPSKITVEGGDSNNLKLLKTVNIDWQIQNVEDIVMLENMSEHLPVVVIHIKECKFQINTDADTWPTTAIGGGIDTRIRGVKIASSEGRHLGFDQDFFKGENLVRYPKLEPYTKEELYRRSILLQRFISLLDTVLPYIVPSWEYSIGSYSSLEVVRQLLPLSKKRFSLLETFIKESSLERPSDMPKLFINRRLAMEHKSDPEKETNLKNTFFMQIYEGLKPKDRSTSSLNYRWSSRYDQWWECKFVAEGVIDQGGGFRDSLSDLAEELCPTSTEGPLPLPFFLRAPNQVIDDSSAYKDVYIPNPGCREFAKYEWIGQVMGACLRGKENLILAFPAFVWKKLAGERVSWLNDYITVDSSEVKLIDNLQKIEKDKFESLCRTWSTVLSDGSVVVLRTDNQGNPAVLLYEDREEYCKTVQKTRLNEANEQLEAIRRGLLKVIPQAVLDLLTWQELERKVCGDPEITIEELRRSIHYDDLEESDTRVKFMWDALKSFTNEDRSRFLRFVTGRRRLPAPVYVSSGKGEAIDCLPESSTCANMIYLPNYTSAKIAEEKLRYACYNCMDMDADVNPDE